MISLLRTVEETLKSAINEVAIGFPKGTFKKAGKISKGENYQGLPYWVLDFPRKFDNENVLALRCMIWWGNEASCTLHLGGEHKREVSIEDLPNNSYFCINESPWEYHFKKDNYVEKKELTEERIKNHTSKRSFIKISRRIPLEELEAMPDEAQLFFTHVLPFLSN